MYWSRSTAIIMNFQHNISRLKALLPASNEYEPDLVRLINVRSFEECTRNEVRYKIMALIARGVSTASAIANDIGIGRTAVYRHLNIMERSGFVVHHNNRYYVAARLFLVYDVGIDSDGTIKIKVFCDRGGFVDGELGFVLVKGPYCKCEVCDLYEQCLAAVKRLAKKLDVVIRSEHPLQAFKEIVTAIAQRDVVNLIKRGYLVLRMETD